MLKKDIMRRNNTKTELYVPKMDNDKSIAENRYFFISREQNVPWYTFIFLVIITLEAH